jgi:putative transposase
MIGVRADGRKELVALTDGYREAAESWADLLRDCRRRGMCAPVLAAGDGALGFWSALREVFPETRAQRCWFHKISNIIAALPKSAHPGRKRRSRRSGTPSGLTPVDLSRRSESLGAHDVGRKAR